MSEYKIWQPMKYFVAKTVDDLKAALNSDEYALQLKIDGASYCFARDLDGSAHVYGDKISKKTGEIIDKIENLPHMKKFIEANFPIGSQLIAEVTCKYNWTANQWEERTNSKYVNSIMLATGDKAAARQMKTEPCGIYIFDILYWDGEAYYEKDFADRYEKLLELKAAWEKSGIMPKWLSFAECIFEDKDVAIAEWLAQGEEGGVLKLLHSKGRTSAAHAVSEIGTTARRPAHTTYKIKQVATVDVVIMGLEWPTKEYKGLDPDNAQYRDENGEPLNRLYALGMINAFDVGAYQDGQLVKIGSVASGLDDNIRIDAAERPDEWIGQTIECSCMSVDKTGHSLRHPRFVRVREDKAAEQCLWNDIF